LKQGNEMNLAPIRPSIREAPCEPLIDERHAFLRNVTKLVRRNNSQRWIMGAALICVLAGFWYHNYLGNEDSRKGAHHLATPVRVALVQRHDLPVVERTIGTVVANIAVQVTPQVQGMLQSENFREGQIVKKGDLLFQIDPRPFEAALAQAKGQLAKDEATLGGAQIDLTRYKTLQAANAIAKQMVDDQAALVATDEGIVQSDRGNVANAEINLGYTRIVSPINGQTGPILIQPGNYVSSTGLTSSTMSTGAISTTTPLVTINQISPIKISLFLPQSDLPRIKARQKAKGLVATIDLSDVGGKNLVVPVYFVGNAVNNLTGTIELRAFYDNSDSVLVPGQLVDVVVQLDNISHATIIPHDALNEGADNQYVYVVANGKAQLREVKVLFDDGKNVAVEGNLKPGDQVVVEGQLQVVPGAAVEIFNVGAGGGYTKAAPRHRAAAAKS
jgi:membrane fusion protein, multidrug efflux system